MCVNPNAVTDTVANCTSSDQSCPEGFECQLDNSVLGCDYNPGEFEKWASLLDIADPNDQEQCEHARVELGFERHDRDDAEACKTFNQFKCNPESLFDDLDDITDGTVRRRPVAVSFPQRTFTPTP